VSILEVLLRLNIPFPFVHAGVFEPGTSEVIYSGSGTVYVGTHYYDLTIDADTILTENIWVEHDLTINSGKALDVNNTNNYDVAIGQNFTNNGTLITRSGEVTFNGTSSTQVISGDTTFYNITLETTTARTISDGTTIVVNGNLTWTAGHFNIGSTTAATLDLANSITIPSSYNLTAISTSSISIAGNWTNNGNFSAGSSTLFFNGTDAQQIGGDTTFYNLVINNNHASDLVSLTVNSDVQCDFIEILDGLFQVDPSTYLNITAVDNTAAQIRNGGELKSNGGTINLVGGDPSRMTVDAGGVLKVSDGSVDINYDLRVDGDVIVELGNLIVDNEMYVCGNFSQSGGTASIAPVMSTGFEGLFFDDGSRGTFTNGTLGVGVYLYLGNSGLDDVNITAGSPELTMVTL